jgi:hypothetical protein
MVLLQLLNYIQSLGENGDQIQPFDLRLGQSMSSPSSLPVQQLFRRAACQYDERAVAVGEKRSPYKTPVFKARSRALVWEHPYYSV